MTGTRIVPLEGGCNFRDFGGYATVHGRSIRWGRLYRSGVLSRLTEGDLATLGGLGLRLVCDLRRAEERRGQPNPDFGPRVESMQWDNATETSPIRSRSFAGSGTRAEAHEAMLRMYQRLPFVMGERLTGVFEGLQRCADGAFVVHCAAGKDRTGIAAALVLGALQVSRASIVEDYVLTNTTVDLFARMVGRDGAGAGLAATAEPILALSPAARAAVLTADPSYINASLDAIDAQYGSLDRYLLAELGVDTGALARLRDWLLV